MPVCKVEFFARKCTAVNAFEVYGMPSPMTAIGFVRALTGRAGISCNDKVLYCVSDFEPHGTKSFTYTYAIFRSGDRDSGKPETQLDDPKANMAGAVVFYADAPMDGLAERIEDQLLGMRFAGGFITESKVGVYDTFDECKKSLRPGFFAVERKLSGTDDPLSEIIREVAVGADKKKGSGWVVPSLMGFRMLGEPTKRKGGRMGLPHVFVDPLIGLMEFHSIRKATEADLWRMEKSGSVVRFTTAPKTEH